MSGLSFVRPEKKARLDQESRLFLLFLGISAAMIAAFVLFLWFKGAGMSDESRTMAEEAEKLKREHGLYEKRIARIEALAEKYEAIQTNNTLLKESIQNLFDLVPDQITLTRAILKRDGLILYGVTPTKEVYNYLLLAPLKSVFQSNATTFYPLKNGWWRFVSINEGNVDTEAEAAE